jgi:hypothetical protein
LNVLSNQEESTILNKNALLWLLADSPKPRGGQLLFSHPRWSASVKKGQCSRGKSASWTRESSPEAECDTRRKRSRKIRCQASEVNPPSRIRAVWSSGRRRIPSDDRHCVTEENNHESQLKKQTWILSQLDSNITTDAEQESSSFQKHSKSDLSPDLSRQPWTVPGDEIIFCAHADLGAK